MVGIEHRNVSMLGGEWFAGVPLSSTEVLLVSPLRPSNSCCMYRVFDRQLPAALENRLRTEALLPGFSHLRTRNAVLF